jgi:Flp pilus assembly protein TadB
MFFMNRPYMMMLFNNTAGISMFGGAVVMMILGAVWLRKIVKIEV